MASGRGAVRWLLPALADVLCLGLFLAALAFGQRMLNTDGDIGRHIAIGRYMLETLSVPTHDLWSHTRAGAELVPHEWLTQVLFAAAERAGGLAGVVVLTSVVIAGTFWGQARWLLGRGLNPYLVFIGVLWGAAASTLHWLTRPHIFTFPFVLLFAWQLDEWRRGAQGGAARSWRAFVFFPALMVLWANLHGAFVVGLVLIGIHGVGALAWWVMGGGVAAWRLVRDLALVGVACVLASLVNPVGLALPLNSFGYVGNRYLVDRTVEYMSPDFHSAATWPFAGLVLVALALMALGGIGRAEEDDGTPRGAAGPWQTPVLMLVVWTAFALYSTRNVPLFALVAVPVLVEAAERAVARAADAGRGWARALGASAARLRRADANLVAGTWAVAGMVALSAGVFSLNSGARPLYRFRPDVLPVAAADYLSAHPLDGPMFNDFTWGGYLLYRLWPAQRVFIDGQTDFYGAELTREYAQVNAVDVGWEAVLARHEVVWIVTATDGPLGVWLRASATAGWRVVWQDETATIFVRAAPLAPSTSQACRFTSGIIPAPCWGREDVLSQVTREKSTLASGRMRDE